MSLSATHVYKETHEANQFKMHQKNTITDGGSTEMHSRAMSGLDGQILLRKLVLQEHLVVLIILLLFLFLSLMTT